MERTEHFLLDLVLARVEQGPEHVALRFGDATLSYAQLATRLELLASRLLLHGVGKGDLVALCVERGLDMVVALLAIWRVGAAYLPIDAETPAARMQHLLGHAHPRLVLAQASTAQLVQDNALPVLLLDVVPAGDVLPVLAAPRPRPDRDDLAYVVFTSGSTGAPKGVEVRHVSLANHALSMAELYGLTPSDRVLCSASIGFDVAAEQIFPALISGAEVVVRPPSLFSSLEHFNRYLHSAAITTVILPSALFHEWTRELTSGRLRLAPSVRAVGAGTEQVAAQHLQAFLACAGRPVRFIQGYGPSEATITCTAYVHDGRAFESGQVVPIGKPLANIEAYVLDPERQLVEDGEVGELYIGGLSLARGYLGRADLTRERFVDSPFEQDGRAKLYRTGDLVRRERDGALYFVGRADSQIKVRGHRVEPEEVEAVLLACPGVVEAAVVQPKRGDGAQLIAYLVSEGTLDVTSMAAFCRARLPMYMVPDVFVQLPSLPKTLNQKVDRAVLQARVPETLVRAAAQRPSSDDELLVARAFREALGTQDVDRDSHFFELGGDSLRALRMLQLLRESHSADLSLADVFQAPTVGALAERLQKRGRLDRPAVLCLKPGTGTPLFLVCGIQIYQALADALPGPSPVYALLLPSEDSASSEAEQGDFSIPDVASFAADYVAIMRAHTPHGPYAVGGLSFGGAVAFEMAQQLVEECEQVSLVALFDTVLPRATRRVSLAWLRHKAQQWRKQEGARQSLGALLRRAQSRLPSRLRTRAASHPDQQPELVEALAKLDHVRDRAYAQRLREFDRELSRYEGATVLYRALDSDQGALVPHHGFAPFAPNLTVHAVPGDHLSLLRVPHVEQLAQHLASELGTS